jgi:hypothetical protein
MQPPILGFFLGGTADGAESAEGLCQIIPQLPQISQNPLDNFRMIQHHSVHQHLARLHIRAAQLSLWHG